MSQELKTPQLRVCVTTNCNLKCKFCRPGGEGYGENLTEKLSFDEIKKILYAARCTGFDCVKFTGGEPLIREDIIELIRAAKRVNFQDVQLVTNGTLLENKAQELKDAGLDMLTISLDAIDEEIYQYMRGHELAPIQKAIYKCQEIGLPVRINMIIIRSNIDQLKPMIKFAKETNCSLKLLDLICLPGIEDFWEKEYVDFDEIRAIIKQMGVQSVGKEDAPGGIGAPLFEYVLNDGTKVLVKDSTQGTYYHESCKECKNYPCQDALISVRVTHDAHLKRCLVRNDNLVELLPMIRNDRFTDIVDTMSETFKLMTESSYHPYAWSPNMIKKEVK